MMCEDPLLQEARTSPTRERRNKVMKRIMRLEKLTAATLICTLATVASMSRLLASEELDLQKLATPLCEVDGLAVAPPSPWFSVPIDSDESGIQGCQMIWEEGDQYMGIIRLVSYDMRKPPEDITEWNHFAVAMEATTMEEMGFKIGKEPIWKRDSVPITGNGFINAKAIGFSANLEGVAHTSETHFLLFESATHKYVISALTPAESASPEVYQANTKAMATVMRTLQPRQ